MSEEIKKHRNLLGNCCSIACWSETQFTVRKSKTDCFQEQILHNPHEQTIDSELLSQLTMMHAALVIWILSAVFCMGRGHHHLGHANQDQETDSSLSQVSTANKEFAFRLYRKLAAHPDFQGKNIFFSPVSISTALAALSVGARGETHQQLFSGLGFNSSQLMQADVDQSFRTLLQNAKSGDTSEGTAVFVDNRFKPQPEFLEVLKQSYFAEGFNVDFTQATESVNTINKYVETKTNGKIDKLVESLDVNTVMYLISYIYFKGKRSTEMRFGWSLFYSKV